MADTLKKRKAQEEPEVESKINRVKPGTNILFSSIFAILALTCVIPAIFIVIISFSSMESINEIGYSFLPKSWSLDAYNYLWNNRVMIGRAFLVSIVVTVGGVLIGLFLTASMGYALSRSNYKLKGIYSIIVFIPMVFGGGLVSTYNVYTSVLGIKDTVWVLILPLVVSSFNVIICRTFFKTTIPQSILESAEIDGASQLRTYFTIVLPISKPLLATIGILLSFSLWNDWFQSLMYISDPKMYSLQAVLMNVEKNIEFLAQNADTMGASIAAYATSMPKEPMRMAMAVLIVAPIACVYPFFQQYFVSGLTIGSVKE